MNDSSSLEQKEPVQKAPFRVLISEKSPPDSVKLIDQAVRNINEKNVNPLIESVTVGSSQNSLDILQEAEKEGQSFNIIIVPGTSKAQIVGPDLLTAIKEKGIRARMLVLTSSPIIEDRFPKEDIDNGRVVVVDRYDVIQSGQMEALLERERQTSLKTNNA